MRSPEKKVCSSDSDSQTDSDSEEKSSSEIKLGVKIDTRPKKESKMEKPFKNLKIDDFEAKLKRQAYKRQNFVGTAEYMAPEVIQMKEVGVYTDLWSLGCIIYQMFMGKSPFEDKTEYLIFQRILNLDYEIDEKKVPQDAADLIRCLLKLDPSERLGCGSENSGNSINQLKSHKFFDDFDKKKYMDFLDLLEDDKQPFKQKIFATEISEKSTKEVVLKSGELKKRSPWFYYDKRLVVLYSTPRIDYIDPITSIVKGTINLTHECEAVLIDSCSFELKTPSRNFKFMCKNKYDISPWVEKINEAIKTYSKL
jgi:serine/threonine protein kinase